MFFSGYLAVRKILIREGGNSEIVKVISFTLCDVPLSGRTQLDK